MLITNEDVLDVEEQLGLVFDDESKIFIKCMESIDIQACPGAGKTTSLVAKLGVLSKQMPFSDNSGILVLTHTNVAVDEIRNKLGADGQRLVSYPNHVGTFQSFINKFLAVPMYVNIFDKKPERIDSEIFYQKYSNRFERVNDFYKNWLKTRADERYISVLSFIEQLELVDDTQLQFKGKNVITSSSPMFKAINSITGIPISVANEGILKYNHCYDLANMYLEKYPNIVKAFQKRFKYVFIDEAQDTDDKQFEILDKLFNQSEVIVQRIGDNNQAIYNRTGKNGNQGWQLTPNVIELYQTKRLSNNNAVAAERVALQYQKLDGNDQITIKPTIIVFNDHDIEKLIPRFSELIIEYDLHLLKAPIFKAVGGVAKENENGHTLKDYFSGYKKSLKPMLGLSIIDQLTTITDHSAAPKLYLKIVVDIVKAYLLEKNIKNSEKPFTKSTLNRYLKDSCIDIYSDYQLGVLKATKKLKSLECIDGELKKILESVLKAFGEAFDAGVLKKILNTYSVENTNKKSLNIYKYEDDNYDFDISVSTIHKVKGETHTATLVLETFNDGYDIFQLLDLLKGNKKKGFKDKRKLIYVAMTRATHLVCLAVHRQHTHRKKLKTVTDEDINILCENGFDVIEL